MKKKIISLICAMIILLLIFGVFICKSRIKDKNNSDDNTSIETSNNKENDNTNDNDNYNNKKNTDDSNQNNVNKNKEKSKDEQKSNNKTDNNNPKTNTKESNKNKTQTITYSCPSGYSLNGKKCISVINANYKCPENTTDYSNEGIPSNTYCVNLNEGYEINGNSCPSGYGFVSVITIGQPTKYKCLPLHNKIYTCPSDYILNNQKCTKTINATINKN